LLKPVRDGREIAWLRDNTEDLVLSAIVLAELRFFVAKQPDGRKKDLASAVLTSIDAGSGGNFADFASDDAAAYGELMARLRRSGQPISAIDGLIAAQAIVRGYTLATRNVSDFERTGVTVINPWIA
jgi:hypothetical protein